MQRCNEREVSFLACSLSSPSRIQSHPKSPMIPTPDAAVDTAHVTRACRPEQRGAVICLVRSGKGMVTVCTCSCCGSALQLHALLFAFA